MIPEVAALGAAGPRAHARARPRPRARPARGRTRAARLVPRAFAALGRDRPRRRAAARAAAGPLASRAPPASSAAARPGSCSRTWPILPKGLWLGSRGRAARHRAHPRALGRDQLDAGADREPAVRASPGASRCTAGTSTRTICSPRRCGARASCARSTRSAWTSWRRRRAESAGAAFVLHMGVDVPERLAPPAAGGRVLAAASLREVKGHVYLFEAARLLRERGVEVQIECIGDGPLRPELERSIAEHGARRPRRADAGAARTASCSAGSPPERGARRCLRASSRRPASTRGSRSACSRR